LPTVGALGTGMTAFLCFK